MSGRETPQFARLSAPLIPGKRPVMDFHPLSGEIRRRFFFVGPSSRTDVVKRAGICGRRLSFPRVFCSAAFPR
jgi:hypothetical protein